MFQFDKYFAIQFIFDWLINIGIAVAIPLSYWFIYTLSPIACIGLIVLGVVMGLVEATKTFNELVSPEEEEEEDE